MQIFFFPFLFLCMRTLKWKKLMLDEKQYMQWKLRWIINLLILLNMVRNYILNPVITLFKICMIINQVNQFHWHGTLKICQKIIFICVCVCVCNVLTQVNCMYIGLKENHTGTPYILILFSNLRTFWGIVMECAPLLILLK